MLFHVKQMASIIAVLAVFRMPSLPGSDAEPALSARPWTTIVWMDSLERKLLDTYIDPNYRPGADARTTVRIGIHDIRADRLSAIKSIRVFVDYPEATADTPLRSKHYCGSIAIIPDDESQSYVLDVESTLTSLRAAKKLDTARGLRITLVPTFDGPPGKAAAFRAVTVEMSVVCSSMRPGAR